MTPAEPRIARIDVARIGASVIGAPLAAFVVCALSIAFAPRLGVEPAFAYRLGLHLFVPLWVVFACVLPLAQSGIRAWALVGVLVVPGLLALLGVPR